MTHDFLYSESPLIFPCIHCHVPAGQACKSYESLYGSILSDYCKWRLYLKSIHEVRQEFIRYQDAESFFNHLIAAGPDFFYKHGEFLSLKFLQNLRKAAQ